MSDIKLGDKIIDLDMSRWKRKEVIATVTKVSKSKITVDNKEFPNSYPHNFYLHCLGMNFDLIGKHED